MARESVEYNLLKAMRGHLLSESRSKLLPFICSINKNYKINWHHKIICDRLSLLPKQKQQRIMIFMPPQTGKSEIVSRSLPPWLLGINPNLRIILASYSSDLSVGFCRDAQKIMFSEDYGLMFPKSYLSEKRVVTGLNFKRTANYFEVVDNKGYMFSVGVGGSTTGKSADIFIIDDPFKDMQQANSESQRSKIIEWYNSVAQTRLSLNGHIIVMHTRWHASDLAGHLITQAKNDPEATQWEVISFPATGVPSAEHRHPKDFRKDGEPLWPEFKGDEDHMLQIRKSVGERVWSALYQQNPVIAGGNIIKENWFRFYTQLPISLQSIAAHKIVQSWDLTFKDTGSSYVVGVVLLKHDADFYIIDFFRERADVVTTIEAIRSMSRKYPTASILIEDKANGPAVLSLLKKELSRMIPIRPTAGKDERLHVVAPLFEAGNVHLPTNAPWTKLIVNELQHFPNSDNDDIVDAVSQGLQHFSKLTGLRHLEAMTRL